MSQFIHMDCMGFLPTYPDNYFDIAIVDPPYFSGPEKRQYYGQKISPIGVKRVYEQTTEWELPTKDSGRIVWDKCNGHSSFSDCELAFCSFHKSTRLFRYMWNGMIQGKSISEGHIMQGNKALNEKRIHPTQKPVNLYRWLLQTYAKEGDLILDTHVGSASSLIACKELGFDYIGFEKDPIIYQKAQQRLTDFQNQLRLL